MKIKTRKIFLVVAMFFVSVASLFSQGYSVVERTDLRRYENGKYIGLTSRETRSYITTSAAPNKDLEEEFSDGSWFSGYFYVSEETNRNMQKAATGIHDSIDSTFHLSPRGIMTMVVDNGFPTFRSFPTFPDIEFQKLKPGDTWEAKAERAVDPLNKGKPTRMSINVVYQNRGTEIYKNEEVMRLKASWNINYNISEGDPRGDSALQRARGAHSADILVRFATGDVILIIDRIDETFFYSDGRQINLKGTLNHFTEYQSAFRTEEISRELDLIVAKEKNPKEPKSFTYEETPSGLRLSLRDLKFKPDSDELLETERPRLIEIAKALKFAEGRHILVEGHTANVGRPTGEQALSEQRARSIAKALEALGVKAGEFITKGYGGNRPIANNDTDEGRALNRRVEITILK